jgi:hypothetical protein
MKAKGLLLLLGVLVGVGLAVLLPQLRDRLLPASLRQPPTEGVIESKRLEEDRLLLTLVTSEGAVLATFNQRLDEIDLLVAKGDTVALALDGYRPFVEDPEIVRVQKAAVEEQGEEPEEAAAAEAETEPAEAVAEPPEATEAEASQPPPAAAPAEGQSDSSAEAGSPAA